jgi:hypothetical protein
VKPTSTPEREPRRYWIGSSSIVPSEALAVCEC